MTTINNKLGKRMLPVLLALVLGLSLLSLPVYAAEEDTTGETQASVTFNAGQLKLISAPAMDFGTHDISAVETEHVATSITSTLRVSDLRGNGAGWSIVATLSEFHLEGESAPTLQAAVIETTSPTVSAVNGTVGTPPSSVTTLTLTSDNLVTPIWEAPEKAGMGVWELVWHTGNTKLIVQPGTAQEGKSVATLTWSLQATP